MNDDAVQRLARKVHAALESADLEQFADLLDPEVTWGAPGDPSPPCQTRAQVLAWYRRGQAQGRRARVLNVDSNRDKILVTMTVTSTPPDVEVDRWQVLTVVEGRVTDIRGYDDEGAALAAAGLVG